MNFFKVMSGLALTMSLGACASTAPASPVALQTRMPEGPEVSAPFGFEPMCDAQADLCGAAPVAAAYEQAPTAQAQGSDASAELTPAVYAAAPASAADADNMALLNAVNRHVNTIVRQGDDPRVIGDPDRWRPPVAVRGVLWGDCKHIAVEKRRELAAQGYPARALTYALVYRRDLGLHVVLVAHTSRGDMVLDSLTPWITAWQDAPYQWVKRQSDEDPRRWVMVTEAPKVYLAQNATSSLTR